MASIPDLRQNQRLGVQGGGDVVSAEAAAMPGNNIVSLGKAVQGFASVLGSMQKKTSYTLLREQYGQDTILAGQNAIEYVRKNINGDVLPDGSNMQNILDQHIQPLMERANQIKDGEARANAIGAVQKEYLKYRGDMNKTSIAQMNNHNFLQISAGVNKMGDAVYNDPTLYNKAIVEAEQAIGSMPSLGVDQQDKIYKQKILEYSSKAIEGEVSRGNFDNARKLLNESVGANLDSKTVKTLTDIIDNKQRMFKNDLLKDKHEKLSEFDRARREEKASTIKSAYSDLAQADSIEKTKAVLDKYQPLLDKDFPSFKRAAETAANQMDIKPGTKYTKFKEELDSGKVGKDFLARVQKEAAGNNISSSHMISLMDQFKHGISRGKKDPYVKERVTLLNKELDKFYYQTEREKRYGDTSGIPIEIKKQAQDLIHKGVAPDIAYRKAQIAVDPGHKAVIGIDIPDIKGDQSNPEQLDINAAKVMNKAHKEWFNMSKEEKAAALNLVKKAADKRKKEAIQRRNMELIKESQVEKQMGNK